MIRLLAVVASAVLLAAPVPAADPAVKPVRALLVIGGGYHDYAKQKDVLVKGIEARGHIAVTLAYEPGTDGKTPNPAFAKPDWAKDFDIVIHDECTADVTDPAVIDRVLQPHRDGLPAVVLHCGMHCFRGAGYPKDTPWFAFTGLATTGHGPQQPIAVTYLDHPITKTLAGWTTVNEELYNNAAGELKSTATAVARGKQGAAESVVAWTNTYAGKTKVFATTLGHNNTTVGDPKYLDLVTRGLLWAAGKLDAAHLKPAPKPMPGE